jgi:hypothetical protein
LADLTAAQSASKAAVVEGTNAKQVRAWSRYSQYLLSIGLQNDPYLDDFQRGEKHRLLSAFCQAIREGRFCHKKHQPVKAESVRATLDCVAQAYKLADRADPRLDTDGKFAFLLQRQLRGYSSTDKPESPQVAITASVLREFYKLSLSEVDKALCELFIGAFFFAMRSCEYVTVSGPRKTKLLCLRNIRFYQGRRLLPHSNPLLHLAECVSITFELQKKDSKNDVITQFRSEDSLLCPVKTWAKIIRRIASYPSSSKETTVNSFLLPNNKLHLFSGTELLKKLRLAAMSIGPDILGFTADQIGLHSARSGSAMAMYLSGVPVFTIMLLGRWSSDAFLRYIRRQVKEFSKGISNKMIRNENFFTIPSEDHKGADQSNHPLKNTSRFKNGSCFKETIRPLANVFA